MSLNGKVIGVTTVKNGLMKSDKKFNPQVLFLYNFLAQEEDGSFWMGQEDFTKHFEKMNVCKVRNWDEVRIKGKFIRVQEIGKI